MNNREIIEYLDRFGLDLQRDHQYARAERFFKQALDLAESINDRSLIIREKSLLATTQVMQGKYQSALSEYTELLQIAYTPELNRTLSETDCLYLARSFFRFVESAQYLPDMKIADLERVLDRGLDWLASVGKREWSAGFHLQKGRLRQTQGHHEEALEEFETALAIARREADKKFASGYTLGHYIYILGNHLRVDLNQPEAAEPYYRELVNGHQFNNLYKQRAWKELAYIALAKKDFLRAEAAAQQALELAQNIESFEPLCATYHLLGNIYWAKNQIPKAIEARIQSWHYARKGGDASWLYSIYTHLAEIRLYQARQDPLCYIPKAQRWLRWAAPLAERLDQKEGTNKRQQVLQKTQAVCEQVSDIWSAVKEVTKQTRSHDYQRNNQIDLSATAYQAYLYETYLLTAEIHLETAYIDNPQEHIPKALSNCQLALPLAKQLDAQERTTIRQREIRAIQIECQRFGIN